MILIIVNLTPTQKHSYRKVINYPGIKRSIRLSKKQICTADPNGEYEIQLTNDEYLKLFKCCRYKTPRGCEIDIDINKISKRHNTDISTSLLYPVHALSNVTIDKYCLSKGINCVCVAKDQLPKKLPVNSAIIINLNDSHQSGSHWVCIVNRKLSKHYFYFDSFGIVYPVELALKYYTQKPFICNEKKLQADDSILCGYYVLRVITDILVNNMTYKQCIDQFTKMPSVINQNLAMSL